MKHKSKKSLIRRISSSVCAALMAVSTVFGSVTFANAETTTSSSKIEVWDFGGVEESGSNYTNYISTSFWDNYEDLGSSGKFASTGSYSWGDLTLYYNGNDRVYYSGNKNAGASALATTSYSDGYTANGMYYANGTGGEARRYIEIKNVEAGEKIIVYMAASNGAESTLYFTYEGNDASQTDTASFTNKGEKYEFIALHDGSYKIYTDGSAGKPIYNRVVRVPGVAVTGHLDLQGADISGYSLNFTCESTGATTEASLNSDGTFSVCLAADETYTATISGVQGYGTTNDSKRVTTTLNESLTGKSNVEIKVEPKNVFQYTGNISGFDSSYDLSKFAVVMEADEESLADDVTLNIAADGSFVATLEPDVEYRATLYGVNDYEILSGGVVNSNEAVNEDIIVTKRAKYDVTGGFTGNESVVPTSIKFINVDDSYEYVGNITDNGYSVSLRDGSYSLEVEIDGYRTTTHIVVNGANVSKDIMFVSTQSKDAISLVSDIYVGYEDKGSLNYNTVNEAVEAASLMNPSSEEERVTIHIAPGTYREQVIVSTPYISFVNDTNEEVLLTWYYGIGYKYYSIDSTGFYNEENAYDKYDKNTATKWGASVYVNGKATGFRASGITFEASFNRYITDEELEDGVEVSGLENIRFERKYGADVTSKTATERATAFAVEATNVELVDCSFLGSQDTLYTGSTNANIYFLNCHIEGNTDYIFGDGNCVFDACDLCFYGYSTGSVGGYITAMKPNSTAGYLFRNCTISANDDLTVTAGYLGRPWGENANVTFLNTKVEGNLILDAGWTEMSGHKPQAANYREYNTVYTDGSAVDLSKRVTGVIDEATAKSISVSDYFGDWIPASYVTETETVSFATVPYVVDNGDINAPYPGHTLTAAYDLGENMAADASVIRWYLVSDDGSEELVKTATATTDVTYQITKDAVGKHVKLVVEPQTISGNVGEAKSYTVEAFVRDGYEDPTGAITDPTLSDGINIYLAGDSTVKDYSANGMYNSGKAQSEGSWGEFLQSYFDSDYVNVVNYANGGRSSRNFINEGSLDKIAATISEGDYLFIQFGHNDCANGSGYIEDRYVPLGTPDENGIYPTTAATEVSTPSSLVDRYGDTYYSYDCGGTYKWYLLQYIEVARNAGATPVLVTPVSRLYFTSEGKIRAHHDSTDTTTNTQVTSNNAYVEAVKQLGEEQNVLVIDAFELTKTLYEETYAADESASNGSSPLATQLFCAGDSTHSSKLGGFVSAALIAEEIQESNLNISTYVKEPTQVLGEKTDGTFEFSVNGKSVVTTNSSYLTSLTQLMLDNIGAKAEELDNATTEPTEPTEPSTDPTEEADTTPHTLWVVGDSTVSSFNDAYYYPRYGYGTQLYKYLTSNITVQNLALSGRSSKSYVNDKEYQTLINGMQEGDYLVIGFGHNDEKAEADRYTNPNGDYTTEGSFANSLYENYIKIAQEKGVTVILCTPVVRRTATGTWSNSNLHITSTSGEYEGGDYAQAIKNLGKDLGITVVDMTTLTKNLYDELGASETLYLHAWNSSSESSVDNTHANIYGATYWAYLLTQAVKETDNSLAKYIVSAQAPTKADTLVVNPEYTEADYTPIAEGTSSSIWKNVGIWSGSVFGNVGGADKISTDNFALEEANGGVRIAALKGNGKIASTVDGLAMYYYKIPVGSTFTLTATATVNSITQNDQVSFGLMARDDMYLDTSLSDALGDYVAAGPLKITKGSSMWKCFARKSGVLTSGGACEKYTAINAGDSFDLKIQSNSDGYACTFGDETTVTGGFDFALTKVDSDYVYVGMFVARQADVTFTDITLVVDGEVVYTTVDTEEPTEPSTEEPTEPSTEEPTEPSTEPSTEEPSTEEPTEPSTEEPSTEVAADEDVIFEMLEGANQTVNAGKKVELVFRSEADFSLFKGVSVDGVVIDPSNYTAMAGSTIITLHEDYVAALPAGEHEVRILSEGGYASAALVVKGETTTEEINNETTEVAADTAVVTGEIAADTDVVAADSSEVATTDKKTADANSLAVFIIIAMLSAMTLAVVSKKREF
ncbi:pectinesterase family protein [Lachnospira multipara]|uniref:GDSL-like Lipase/Acylhydrolase family protein n=1 Tax=Lachnospira multipara TaxID=28051 RepID=A0A1H5WLJ0_9FIRM|nr:pectinesterase family protein [Lachnospira multipara]SEG00191.1 GDSL-like Lipase/Acylhydrolase family protein [Lachnospira multipara]